MPGGDGVPGAGVGGGGRVAGEAVEGGDEPVAQPARRGVALHVDGEVEQAGRDLGVAVVAQGGRIEIGEVRVVGCAPCGGVSRGRGIGGVRHGTPPYVALLRPPSGSNPGAVVLTPHTIDGETSSPLSALQSRVVPDGTTAHQGEIP